MTDREVGAWLRAHRIELVTIASRFVGDVTPWHHLPEWGAPPRAAGPP